MLGDLGRLGVGESLCFMCGAWLVMNQRKPNVIDRKYLSGSSDWLSRADDMSQLACIEQ
jgi:hypothetical protein